MGIMRKCESFVKKIDDIERRVGCMVCDNKPGIRVGESAVWVSLGFSAPLRVIVWTRSISLFREVRLYPRLSRYSKGMV